MNTICFINQKGGVAKTTSAAACAEIWARQGKKVLAIDMDPQGSLGVRFGILDASDIATIYDVLTPTGETFSLVDALARTASGLYLVPSDIMLAGLELELASAMDRVYRLANALDELEASEQGNFDVCVIDCPPSLGLLTQLALMAADHIVIPTSAGLDSMRGMKQLSNTIAMVRNPHLNPDLKIAGIAVTMYERQLRVHKDHMQVIEDMAAALKTKVLEPPIRKAVAVEKALDAQETVVSRFPNEAVTKDYYALADAIAREIGMED